MANFTPFEGDLKSKIFQHDSLLTPVFDKAAEVQVEGKSLNVNVGVKESGYDVTRDGDKTTVTFSYTIDNDNDSSTGYLSLQDHFVIDSSTKQLLGYSRTFNTSNQQDVWTRASQRLATAKKFTVQSGEVKDFFANVVAGIKLPEPEKAPAPEQKAPVPPSPAVASNPTAINPFTGDLKSKILGEDGLFENIFEETSKLSENSKALNFNIGASGSGLSSSLEEGKAIFTFSYVIDNDSDASNGRLILKDRFELDPTGKTLLSFSRTVEGDTSQPFWSNAKNRLLAKKFNEKNAAVKSFFQNVVSALPIPEAAPVAPVVAAPVIELDIPEVKSPPVPSSKEVVMLSQAKHFAFGKNVPESRTIFTNSPSPRHDILYGNRTQALSATQSRMDYLLESFSENATSPAMIASFFVGASFFRVGKIVGMAIAPSSEVAAGILSTTTGLMFEVPAFELTHRSMTYAMGGEFNNSEWGTSLLRNFLTFGAFRSVGAATQQGLRSIPVKALPWGEATYKVAPMITSFGALHGVNELERRGSLRPGAEDNYTARIMEDAILFAQMSATSELADMTFGKSVGQDLASHERAAELRHATQSYFKGLNAKAEVLVRGGSVKGEGKNEFVSWKQASFLRPDQTSWILGTDSSPQGFKADVRGRSATSTDQQVLVTKAADGKFSVEKLPTAPGKQNVGVEILNRQGDSAGFLSEEFPVEVQTGSVIRIGSQLFEIKLKGKEVPAQAPQAKIAGALPAVVEPPAPPIKIELEVLETGAPILATDIAVPTGAPRELNVSRFITQYGEVSAFTGVGIDKGASQRPGKVGVNEDAFGMTLDQKGYPVLIVADGMGGHGAGDVASAMAVHKMVEIVRGDGTVSLADAALATHSEIANNGKGQTVMGALRIRPDGRVEHVNAGDIRFWVIRAKADGSREVIEPHLPDTQAASLKSGGHITTTVELNAHPLSSRVLSGLGMKVKDSADPSKSVPAQLNIVNELQSGGWCQLLHNETLKINTGTPDKPVMEDLVLQPGDVLMLASDGVADLMSEAQLLDVTKGHTHAAELQDVIEGYTVKALDLYKWRIEKGKAESLDKDEKIQIPSGSLYEGMIIDAHGNIYEPAAVATGWALKAHVGPDNITALIYRHNPQQINISLPEPKDAITDPKIQIPPTFKPVPEISRIQLGDLPNLDVASSISRVEKFDGTPLHGPFAFVTTQGIGYGDNADAVAVKVLPNGTIALLNSDGAGGSGDPQMMSRITSEALQGFSQAGDMSRVMTEANARVHADNLTKGHQKSLYGYGVAVGATIEAPAKVGDPHLLHFNWAGDARGMLLRRDGGGHWQWVYSTVEENAPNYAARNGMLPRAHAGNMTQEMVLAPNANFIMNNLGTEAQASIRSTAEGEIPDPSHPLGRRPAPELEKGIPIQKGDLALLASDGLYENYLRTRLLLDMIQFCKTPAEVVEVLTRETHARMDILDKAYNSQFPKNTATGLSQFEHNGKTLFIDGRDPHSDTFGRVYESDDPASPVVDHYKKDNFSVMAYMHDPVAEIVTPPAPPTPPSPPAPVVPPPVAPPADAKGTALPRSPLPPPNPPPRRSATQAKHAPGGTTQSLPVVTAPPPRQSPPPPPPGSTGQLPVVTAPPRRQSPLPRVVGKLPPVSPPPPRRAGAEAVRADGAGPIDRIGGDRVDFEALMGPPQAATLLPPVLTPVVLPSALPFTPQVIKMAYRGKSMDLTPSSEDFTLGRNSQPHLFTTAETWVAGEHVKIKYVLQNTHWVYEVTALDDTGLHITGALPGRKTMNKMLKKGESTILGLGTFEFKFKKSPTEWDVPLLIFLNPIQVN